MGNRLFALASVSALSGLVAAASASGCSSTEIITVTDGGRDARSDRIGDNEEPPVDTCMDDRLLDHTTVTYKPAAVKPAQCTLQAIKVLEDLVASKTGGVPFAEVKKALEGHDPTCAKCVFAEETDGKWAPIVEKGGSLIVNVGGCVEIVSGKADCGKAWQQFDTCTNFGCKDCKTDVEAEQCYKSVGDVGGPCEAATKDVRAACGSNLLDYIETCYPENELTISGPIIKQCIEGTSNISDAGNDGDG